MDLKNILEQAELGKKEIEQIKTQNRIFEALLDGTLKNAPESDKNKIQEVKNLSLNVINLAKEGKTTELNELINKFKNDKNF